MRRLGHGSGSRNWGGLRLRYLRLSRRMNLRQYCLSLGRNLGRGLGYRGRRLRRLLALGLGVVSLGLGHLGLGDCVHLPLGCLRLRLGITGLGDLTWLSWLRRLSDGGQLGGRRGGNRSRRCLRRLLECGRIWRGDGLRLRLRRRGQGGLVLRNLVGL